MTNLRSLDPKGRDGDTPARASALLSMDEALNLIEETIGVVRGSDHLALGDARGRILAEPVRARSMAPPFDNAAMDGYALSAQVLLGEAPWTLQVTGRITAGKNAEGAFAGAGAVQILTGAPMPVDADTVVKQENVETAGDRIIIKARPGRGENVRRAGEDMSPDQTIVDAGRRLGPGEIGACAAAGFGTVEVRRRIRVAILASGDEVRPAGEALAPALIWDVNTPMLAAAMGSEVEIVEVSRGADCLERLRKKLRDLKDAVDLIVTTGGISVGATDFVKPAVADLGGQMIFSGVAMKPGKPVSLGRVGRAIWLGLPGNPVSAFTTWVLFGSRILERLGGAAAPRLVRRQVVLAGALRHTPGRCELRLARIAGFDGLGREIVTCHEATHSARVSHLAGADGLIVLPAEADTLSEGELVTYLPFHDN